MLVFEFLNELQCTMSVRLITIVFISEQPRYVYSPLLSTALHNDSQHLPLPGHRGSDHFVSSSDVTFDIKLDIEVGTERVRTPAPGLCKIKMMFISPH